MISARSSFFTFIQVWFLSSVNTLKHAGGCEMIASTGVFKRSMCKNFDSGEKGRAKLRDKGDILKISHSVRRVQRTKILLQVL